MQKKGLLPAAKLTETDVLNVKKIPKAFANILKRLNMRIGEKGEQGYDGLPGPQGKTGQKGDKGTQGEKGKDGKNGKDGRNGIDGRNGKDGKNGKDGRDGKDADIAMLQSMINDDVLTAIEDHEKEFDHNLIHDPKMLGIYEVDFSSLGEKKFLTYDPGKKKLVFDFLPKVVQQGLKYLSTGGNNDSSFSKSITIMDPGATEDISLLFTDDPITITKVAFVLTGGTSVTVTLRHDADRNATGTELVTGGTVVNSSTTGNIITAFDANFLHTQDFLWLETTALNGTPDSLHVTFFYRKGS